MRMMIPACTAPTLAWMRWAPLLFSPTKDRQACCTPHVTGDNQSQPHIN